MEPTITKFLKRTIIFFGIWLGIGIIINLLGSGSNKEEDLNNVGGLWLWVGIGIYIWKVWKLKISLLKKILNGILVNILISSLGIFLAIFGFPTAFGFMLGTYLFLILDVYKK